ncbi:MAG TPA: glycosyl hydrolase [Bryobacteraceae bacterium]|nr:glycosyl hydrolase [Bryobacteraceae bacterium]
MTRLLLLLCAALAPAVCQERITIHVDTSKKLGPMKQVWGFFGYDEPNYTYTADGKKLIGELAALAPQPVYIRTHFLLASGDAQSALKWGSTNAYTEDASGKPIYDWTVIDRIFDTYLQAGAKPFVEIGFMPEALSTHPEPYRHEWPKSNFTGWSYPPNDYNKWSELIYHLTRHCVEKYGTQEAQTWYWEVWNEPDIAYWHGTPEEYDKLYDSTVKAVKRALPAARVGGPATTGPGSQRSTGFLRQFLEHCDKTGAPLDFISFHAKGQPHVVDGHVRMGLTQELNNVQNGVEIVRSFQKFASLPIILSEADPEGCAACSQEHYPQNAYRNGSLYPAYDAAALDGILKIAARSRANVAGMLTWAFEFEAQPYFAGFRELATNGIDKPILNLFRMLGQMTGDRIESTDSLVVANDHTISVLVWNFQADDVAGPAQPVSIAVTQQKTSPQRVLMRQFRIDDEHSNAYTAWRRMGSPQKPTAEQYEELERAGQLQLFESPKWISAQHGSLETSFDLPRNAVSLVQFSW